MYMLKKTGIFI